MKSLYLYITEVVNLYTQSIIQSVLFVVIGSILDTHNNLWVIRIPKSHLETILNRLPRWWYTACINPLSYEYIVF